MEVEQRDIISIDFPFSDGVGIKRRPALVLSGRKINQTGDILLMLITSRQWHKDEMSFILENKYLSEPLPVKSILRLHKVFTVDSKLVVKKLSELDKNTFKLIITRFIQLVEE